MDSITVPQEKRYRSVFEVPADYFDACRLISSSSSASDSVFETFEKFNIAPIVETLEEANEEEGKSSINDPALPRWTCNTCKAEFESLQDQRSHFKSDFHRINVKLSMAGKDIVNEEDLDDFTSDTFKDYDISSISGSEDEADRTTVSRHDMRKGAVGSVEQKLLVRLKTGEKISLWRSMVLNEFESISYEIAKEVPFFHSEHEQCLKESEVVERLKALIHEPRDKTRLRIVLLAGGGHFAGCVFDGNSVVAHKTFHRYVVRARAGKKQSSKDASGRMAHSAGASLRRYNELALKKDIQDLLAAWKPYFDSSTSIFIHAPSSNRQLLYDGGKAYFSHQHALICNVPFNVRRPTLKEARRIYNQMTQVSTEVDEKDLQPASTESFVISESPISDGSIDSKKEGLKNEINSRVATEDYSSHVKPDELLLPSESEVIGVTTPLHEAAQSSDADKVLELLKQGMDPCVIDERGRTPYMLASEKEVRNTFRRFMASNLDTWDWHAAKVPSALTKEMEDSQAAKQAEKDAKKKARAKELKKLRKAKEKAQAEANTKAATESRAIPSPATKGQPQQSGKQKLSKEEELKRAQAEEREKRAAAAERRMAAGLNAQGSGSSTTQPKPGLPNDMNCSCCNASLAGKVPFHRYNYKYCTTACMHLHKEILEDG